MSFANFEKVIALNTHNLADIHRYIKNYVKQNKTKFFQSKSRKIMICACKFVFRIRGFYTDIEKFKNYSIAPYYTVDKNFNISVNMQIKNPYDFILNVKIYVK